MARIDIEHFYPHPPERVFDRYVDHASWTDWAGIGRVYLVAAGAPDRDGVGCVRAFDRIPGLREKVLSFERPKRMTYSIVRGGYPATNHLGEVTFDAADGGTRVRWVVTFGSRLPGAGAVVATVLRFFLRRGLRALERDLAR